MEAAKKIVTLSFDDGEIYDTMGLQWMEQNSS